MKFHVLSIIFLLWRTISFGQTAWQPTTPFPKTDGMATNSFAVSPKTGAIFVSVEEEGLQRSSDQGRSWTKVLNEPVFTVKVRADGTIFAGGIGKMHVSADEGQTWITKSFTSVYPVATMVFNQQGHIFIGTSNMPESSSNGRSGDGIFTSTDNGQSWHSFNSGLGSSLNVAYLVIDSQDRLYAGINENEAGQAGGLFTKSINEATWTRIAVTIAELQDIRVSYVHMLGTDQHQHLYATVEGSYGSIGVWRTVKSTDGGATWQVLALRESPNGPYYDTIYLQSFFLSKSGLIWTSIPARQGILYADENGNNWVPHTTGISATYNIVDFAETSQGVMLALKRFDTNLVYTMNYPLNIEDPVSENKPNLQCYPNPFTENLIVKYTLTKPASVQLRIFDLVGKEVFSEVKTATAGTYTLHWQPSQNAASLYVVHIQTGAFKEIKKVIYLK